MHETRGHHYEFEDLGDGIQFGRARSDGTGLCNTGVVDLGGSTLVFDTSLTLRSAREIHATALARTGRRPSLSVNSHWHLDHIVGNPVFSESPIYASRRTVELLVEKRSELEGELRRDKLEADLRELEHQRAASASSAGRSRYDAVIRINRALLEETADLRLAPPTHTFEDELDLPGPLGARLLTYGAGHTDSDSVLFLSKARVLFAGDLVVAGTHPNLLSGDPVHWITVLDALEALRPETVATGHGPLASTEQLGVMKDYLSTVLELARRPGKSGMPQRFRTWTEPDQFTQNLAFARTWLAAPR